MKQKYSVCQNVGFMLKRAWKTAKSVIFLCILTALLAVGLQVTQLFIAPVILQKIETTAPLPELLAVILIFSVLLLGIRGLQGYLESNTLFNRIAVRTKIIQDVSQKALTTSYPNTRDPEALNLQRLAMDGLHSNDCAGEHIWTTLGNLLENLLGFGLYLALLSNLNWMLLAVILATTALGFFVSRYLQEWGYRHREERAEYNKKLRYFRSQPVKRSTAKDIRIFGLGAWLEELYESTARMRDAFVKRRERVYTWTCVVDAVLQFARNGIAYFYLLHMALEKELPASEFLLYFTAFSGFSQWVTGILQEASVLHKESLDLSNVQAYLHLPEPFRMEGGKPIPKSVPYELTLDRVTFTYPGADRPTIENMDLTMHPGEKLALVGLNGAGKTTLVRLLCGFYDPDEGRVLLNGTDIREFNRREYYALFSAVFQEMSVLSVTVAETVAQSGEEIDREKVWDCIEKAGLTRKIQSLPKQLDTTMGREVYLDGMEFSGGETQRLMLARALYKDGPMLILDEPTAALDPLAENDIYQKYNEMTQGKTSLFISHRLASTRFCDRILFLDHGKIREEGTHEELLRRGGEYAKLFAVQARYYQEGADFREEN